MHLHAESSTSLLSRILSRKYCLIIVLITAIVNVKTASIVAGDSSEAIVIKNVDIPEDRVTYEGAQVWRVAATDEQYDFVSYLQETGGINEIG